MWSYFTRYPVLNLGQISGCEYDYIVVGGGTAGCAIASRLSEDPGCQVLLLEKGGLNDSWLSRVPLISISNGTCLLHKPTILEERTKRQGEIRTAETIGGNSRINGMIYTRGSPAYYDRWASQVHPSWSWANVEPYFRKVEGKCDESSNKAKGKTSGNYCGIQTRQGEPTSKIYPYFQKSVQALGLRPVADINHSDAPAMGYYNLDLTIDSNGYRHSADRAYLPFQLAFQRRNSLHICTNTVVSRLDIAAGSDVVSGVIVRSMASASRLDKEIHIGFRREIILCAGAISTPQILQLSGIGPAELLRKHEIPVRQDLFGVGSRLSDHSAFPVFIEVSSHDTFYHVAKSLFQTLKQFLLFIFFRSGWFSSCLDRVIYLNTSYIEEETMTVFSDESALDSSKIQNIPDVEIMVIPINTRPELYPSSSLITLTTCLNQPFSTGSVEICSTDPLAHPTIRLNQLSDPRDQEVGRKGLKFALHLAEHFIKHSGYPETSSVFNWPRSKSSLHGDWRMLSDDELDKHVEDNIDSVYHLTSSCAMGRRDAGGVVDESLLVRGFRNLRIADASVFPGVVPAHPAAAVYMIAERCADFIKETWKRI
ncbi:putative GMC oxidoreductase [Whalleya microplaca]|nr:putative GMC oxidoreductase [Whalleya microplaca]